MKLNRKPTHPGEFLREEILEVMGISVTLAAESLGITRKSLSTFINGHSRCSRKMAYRLSKATRTDVEFWINMQAKLDIWEAERVTLDNEVLPLL